MTYQIERPKLEVKVDAVLQAVAEPLTIGKMTTVRCMGPSAKAKSDDLRGSYWVEVKATGRAGQLLQGLHKGDRFRVAGNQTGAEKWVDKSGVVRDGGMQIWASEVELWTPAPVDEPIHDSEIPF